MRSDIFPLINNGQRQIPVKMIVDYRYLDVPENEASISIYGAKVGSDPVVVVNNFILRNTTKTYLGYAWSSTEIALLVDKDVTGIWFEMLSSNVELNRISLVYNQGSITGGVVANSSDDKLSIKSYTINDGSIFSPSQTVVLNNVCIGNPTEIRYSRFDNFSDADWVAYSTNPTFELYSIGVNRIYLQVRNELELSEIEYREVAWHGYEELKTSDSFIAPVISFGDSITVSYAVPNYNNIYQDSLDVEIPIFSDNVSIWKGVV